MLSRLRNFYFSGSGFQKARSTSPSEDVVSEHEN